MQVKIKQISGLQDIINSPVSMGIEYSQSFNILVASTGNEFQTGVTMDYTPFVDSVIQVQVNGLTVEGSYTDKLGGFYFSSDGTTVKSIVNLESGDFLYWNGIIKGYQLEVGDIVTILYEKEYLSYGTSGISGISVAGTSGTSGVNGASGLEFTHRSTWDSSTQYYINNIVNWNGSSYVCRMDTIGFQPYYESIWGLIAMAGTSGIDGLNGSTVTVVSPTTSYTILTTDYLILCNPVATGMTVTLPTAVGASGKVYWIKNIQTADRTVTINTTSSQNIESTTTLSLAPMGSTSNGGTSYIIVSNGTQWYIITQH